ncbi:MAG: c-type cytochrome [Rhodobacteraceae bacterium]|nr:MAG: c-type cytochrome [Paracoccaceae bacterium]
MTWRGLLSLPRDGRSVVKTLGFLALAGLLGAGAVVGFGLYNVSAKSGHWAGVSWVLHTTFRNAVRLRADATPPEDLDSPAMVALGARHFDSACRTCHASPGRPRSATVRAMVPAPPHVSAIAGQWQPQELHWIVHQGAKMTGMPAWPATRADDVWPVVAFLRAAPDMSAQTYRDLTESPEGQSCAMCHGAGGASGNPQIPRLDILSEAYIAASLRAYRSGARDSGIMAEAMSHVPEAAIPEIAARMAAQVPVGPAQPMNALARRGEALALRGGGGDVPSCAACHGPWDAALNPLFPSLAGQHAPYLRQQLRLWREAARGGGPVAQLMHHAARDLTEEDIAALAAYYASLAPAKLDRTGK